MIDGIGIDVVDIERFKSSLDRTPGLIENLFTENERTKPISSLAARFAVREATMKALGVGLGAFDFHDVSVEKQSSGAPRLVVTGRALALAESHGVGGWHVSITHTDTVAMAVVAAL